jgi:hypothetical protein
MNTGRVVAAASLVTVTLLGAACGPAPTSEPSTTTPTATSAATVTPSATPVPTPTWTPTSAATPTATPPPTATPTRVPLWTPTPGAEARVILVTSASDALNGNTASVDALTWDPGPDGISLREAIAASNNSLGPERIEFWPDLAGSPIYVGSASRDALPIMTGGGLTIDGDVDHDGEPDIVIDGSQGEAGGPTSNCFSIWSSDNTITGLVIRGFHGTGIGFAVPPFHPGGEWTVSGNTIIGNHISTDFMGVVIGPLGLLESCDATLISQLTWDRTVIARNRVTGGTGVFVMAGIATAANNRILHTVIAENHLVSTDVAIGLFAADTNSVWHGISGPIEYADNNEIRGVIVANNLIEDVRAKGIEVAAANMGNRDNHVSDVAVMANTIVGEEDGHAIGVTVITSGEARVSGRTMSGNTMRGIDIRGNRIEDTYYGVCVRAADARFSEQSPGISGNSLEGITIAENHVCRSREAGIAVWGGMSTDGFLVANNSITEIAILDNLVLFQTEPEAAGIYVTGGWAQDACAGCAVSNSIEGLMIAGNRVIEFDFGLRMYGGRGQGAEGNRLGVVTGANVLSDATCALEVYEDWEGATESTLEWREGEIEQQSR